MFSVTINEKGGAPRVMEFDKPEVTIGRVQGNDIILPKGNISKRHSRIVLKDGKFIIVDLKSTNGTYVNGRKITSPHILKDADKIYIGDFTLTVEPQGGRAEPAASPAPPPPRPQKPAPPRRAPEPPPPEEEDDFEEFIAPEEDYGGPSGEEFEEFAPEPEYESPETAPPPPPPSPPRVAVKKSPKRPAAPASASPRRPAAASKRRSTSNEVPEAQAAVFATLMQKADLAQLADDPAAAEQAVRRAYDEASSQGGLSGSVDGEAVVTRIVTEILGLGPLDALLNDDNVTQIFANSPHSIFVEQGGEIAPHDTTFSNAESMTYVIQKLLRASRATDGDSPIVDTRLVDGTHVSALLPPVGARGPVLTLRKPVQPTASLEQLVADGSLTEGMAEFLQTCVTYRKNVVVSANSAADGTAFLRALASAIGEDERIVTVEEVSQLSLPQSNVVSLEAAPMAGDRGVGIRDLVRMALRLGPDRLVVGDCRGGEALEILQAMGGALDGSLLLVHGHSARDCVSRIEAMALMGGIDATARALREAIVNAVEVIVQVSRFADGIPRITQIAAVSGMEVDLITMQDVFTFRAEGTDKEGNTLGRFLASGVVPLFFEELQKRGEKVNMGIFREGE